MSEITDSITTTDICPLCGDEMFWQDEYYKVSKQGKKRVVKSYYTCNRCNMYVTITHKFEEIEEKYQ